MRELDEEGMPLDQLTNLEWLSPRDFTQREFVRVAWIAPKEDFEPYGTYIQRPVLCKYNILFHIISHISFSIC